MKKISPEEYWKWDKFEGETSAEDMKEDFKRYVKEHYGKNIEFVESDNPDTFKALFQTVEREGAVVKALKEIRAEITGNLETIIGKYDSNTKPEDMPSRKIERNNGRTEAIDIIDRKIKEIKND